MIGSQRARATITANVTTTTTATATTTNIATITATTATTTATATIAATAIATIITTAPATTALTTAHTAPFDPLDNSIRKHTQTPSMAPHDEHSPASEMTPTNIEIDRAIDTVALSATVPMNTVQFFFQFR
ncbi:15762_t:CDS:2 [Rhizophagus irregularis]|nr:15762_t:CDS:2 [Rhizophagus irregularis]